MNISDYIIDVLASRGVTHVFGYPGAAILPLMGAIDRHPKMEWVLMRHEGSASLAASMEARLTGKLAVCMASSGPGATNLLTGLFDAHLERSPVLVLTGLVPTWASSREGFQDIDQTQLTRPLVPRSLNCIHPDQVPLVMRDSIGEAEQQRIACHLALPLDIQSVEIDETDARFKSREIPEPLRLQPPPAVAFDVVAADLSKLDDIVIVVGSRALGAGEQIEVLATKLKAPIISALDAKGIIDDSHPCALGVMGIFGSPGVESANRILGRAKAILAIGVDNIAPFVMGKSGEQERILFQCEPDFSSISHRFKRERTLVGPVAVVAQELSSRITGERSSALTEEAAKLRALEITSVDAEFTGPSYADPIHVMRKISGRLGAGGVVVTDVGESTIWAAKFMHFTERQRLLASNVMGVMGIALPGAVAVKLKSPDSQVVATCGDGSFQMSLAEVMSAVQAQTHIVILLFHNTRLQRVAAQQTSPFGTQIVNPDFMKFAEACGIGGAVIDGDTDIDAVLDEAFAPSNKPFLIDCRLHPNLKVPMTKSNDDFIPMNFG